MPKFRIHPEGRQLLLITFGLLALINVLAYLFLVSWFWPVLIVSVIFFLAILQFFRNPIREIPTVQDNLVYAPADGKVVVIEQTTENEYFQDQRRQLSIFMSPVNVHVNRSPVSGLVKYYRYHPGRYLVAWHPKSSTENERTTTVIETGETEILMRQIAGAVAKRIKNYLSVGDEIEQGVDIGFIKFGSRVDIFLPLDAEIMVELNQAVIGNKTVIARLK